MQKKRRFTKQQMEINSAMGTLQYGQILLDIVKGKILDIRENKMVNWINEFDKLSANCIAFLGIIYWINIWIS